MSAFSDRTELPIPCEPIRILAHDVDGVSGLSLDYAIKRIGIKKAKSAIARKAVRELSQMSDHELRCDIKSAARQSASG